MKLHSLLSAALVLALIACGGGDEAAPGATDDDAGSEPAAGAAAPANPADAIGRCAVDARDGAPYGKIAAAETDAASGETMFQIEGEGGTVWNKKAGNVRVVDCP